MDSIEDVYSDYAVDPSLARLRRGSDIIYPSGHVSHGVVVLADTPMYFNEADKKVVGELFIDMGVLVTYVLKFYEGLVGVRAIEWQAAKALVAREVALLKPKVWLPCGPVSCELLGTGEWKPVVAAVAVDHTKRDALVVQGRWENVRKTVDILLDPEAGFTKRG